MKLRIQPTALLELDAAMAHYESERPGLGLELLDAVEEAIEFAVEMPAGGQRYGGELAERDVRRFVVKRFPYVLVVAPIKGKREVVAIAHTSRRPDYWRDRLD